MVVCEIDGLSEAGLILIAGLLNISAYLHCVYNNNSSCIKKTSIKTMLLSLHNGRNTGMLCVYDIGQPYMV